MQDGHTLTFDVLKKGSIFGDGSFAEDFQREVDISAVTDVELIECDTDRLFTALTENKVLLQLMKYSPFQDP